MLINSLQLGHSLLQQIYYSCLQNRADQIEQRWKSARSLPLAAAAQSQVEVLPAAATFAATAVDS
jgi:hypothetical protein